MACRWRLALWLLNWFAKRLLQWLLGGLAEWLLAQVAGKDYASDKACQSATGLFCMMAFGLGMEKGYNAGACQAWKKTSEQASGVVSLKVNYARHKRCFARRGSGLLLHPVDCLFDGICQAFACNLI